MDSGSGASVTGIFHPTIVVSSLDEGLIFFRDLLGMRVTFDAEHDPASQQLLAMPAPRVRALIVECLTRQRSRSLNSSSPRPQLRIGRSTSPGSTSCHFAYRDSRTPHSPVRRRLRVHEPDRKPTVAGWLHVPVGVCRGPDGTAYTLTEFARWQAFARVSGHFRITCNGRTAMRLATARQDRSIRLFAQTHSRYFDLVLRPPAGRRHPRWRRRHGALYRRGEGALDARRLAASGPTSDIASVELESLDLAPPVIAPLAMVCMVGTTRAHQGGQLPDTGISDPLSKYTNTLVGHGDGVIHHAITRELDYEGELAFVVGRRAAHVSEADAMSYVAGYTMVNDISARNLQLGDLQWIRGKSLDTYCPIGPVFVTADEVADVDALLFKPASMASSVRMRQLAT